MKQNKNLPLPLVIIYALEVTHAYYSHTMETLQCCGPVHLFPALSSVTTLWQLEFGHDGNVYTEKLAHTVRAFFMYNFMVFTFGCAGSSLLPGFFSSCSKRELLSSCRVWLPIGFSCCRAQPLGFKGFRSCGSWALEHRFNSCGKRA